MPEEPDGDHCQPSVQLRPELELSQTSPVVVTEIEIEIRDQLLFLDLGLENTIDDMGNASFDFMGGDPSAIRTVSSTTSSSASVRYDLSGRQVTVPAKGQMYIVRQADGMTKIVIEK